MSVPEDLPTTEAELYDLLQHLFGIGDYDDLAGRSPWFKARMVEIGRLKKLCRARKATPRQVAIAAWYAKERDIPVRASHRLFPLIPDAMRAHNQARIEQERQAAEDERRGAVAQALAADRQDWVDRLQRATPDETSRVIKEWRAQR